MIRCTKEEKEMKKLRAFLMILAAVMLVQVTVPVIRQEAQAASTRTQKRNGFYREREGKYCYYKKGKKLKKKWKKVNGYYYYFGKDGYAHPTTVSMEYAICSEKTDGFIKRILLLL